MHHLIRFGCTSGHADFCYFLTDLELYDPQSKCVFKVLVKDDELVKMFHEAEDIETRLAILHYAVRSSLSVLIKVLVLVTFMKVLVMVTLMKVLVLVTSMKVVVMVTLMKVLVMVMLMKVLVMVTLMKVVVMVTLMKVFVLTTLMKVLVMLH